MRRQWIWLLALALCAGLAAAEETAYTPRYDADGWEVLFDGKDLNAWQMDGQQGVWGITDAGEMAVLKSGRSIFTKERYCDYVVECDWKLQAHSKGNSGLFIRVHRAYDEVNTGMECQILDNGEYNAKWDDMNANGALYDLVHPTLDVNKPAGEWNHYKVTAIDNLITIELNYKVVVEADLNKWTTAHKNPDGKHNKFPHAIGSLPREGFVGLQNYGGVPFWAKNVRLKKLSDRQPKWTGKEPIEQVLTPLPQPSAN
jgi:hypothetical protein